MTQVLRHTPLSRTERLARLVTCRQARLRRAPQRRRLMRIEIVPGAALTGPRAGAAGVAAYPTLAKLSPSGELVLIELQGSLEMDGVSDGGGQTIGTLHFPPGREVRATHGSVR